MKCCEWIIDNKSGDLVMICHDDKEGARVPKAAISATTSSTGFNNVVVEKLKLQFEQTLHCITKGQDNERRRQSMALV